MIPNGAGRRGKCVKEANDPLLHANRETGQTSARNAGFRGKLLRIAGHLENGAARNPLMIQKRVEIAEFDAGLDEE